MEDKSIVIKKINQNISQLKKLNNQKANAKKVTKAFDNAKGAICSYSMRLSNHLKNVLLTKNPNDTSRTYTYGNDIYNHLVNAEMANHVDITNIAISDLSIQDLGNPQAAKAIKQIKQMTAGTYVQDKNGKFNYHYLNPKVAVKMLKASVNDIKNFNLQHAINVRKRLATVMSSDEDKPTGNSNDNSANSSDDNTASDKNTNDNDENSDESDSNNDSDF